MSHESLSAAWSALTELQDLTAGLRDVVGNSTLRSIRSTYHPEETPRRFLEYAHELDITFDTVRFLSKVDSKNTALLQEDLVSAVAHFLNGVASSCVGDDHPLRDASQRFVLGHAFCSAVAALRTCAWDCRPELRTVLTRHAGKILTNAPVKDESLWLFQTLANLLLIHYGSAAPLGQGIDQSQTRWKMLWEAKSGRQNIIEEMVKRATDNNVASSDRVLPMLDLCQLYWDTESLLIQCCAGFGIPRWLERVFYVPSDIDAVRLALQIRSVVQEQFALRSISSSSTPDHLQTRSYVMVRPGLSLQCVSDTCSCQFDSSVIQLISGVRTQQSPFARSGIAAAYGESSLADLPAEFFNRVHSGLAQRLRPWARPSMPFEGQEKPSAENLPPMLSPNSTPFSSSRVDGPLDTQQQPAYHARSASQPNIHGQYLRPELIPNRSSASKATSSSGPEMWLGVQKNFTMEPIHDAAPRELNPSSPEQPQSPSTAPELDRTESVTTGTTSTGFRSTDDDISRIPSAGIRKRHDGSFPEAVHIFEDRPVIISPEGFEKCYPEVVTDPISAIQEDNLSLFSDGGSIPYTNRSGGRVAAQKGFSLFKGIKRNSNFAVPLVRFFNSGKTLLAWTRYGGICLDVVHPDKSNSYPVNVGDIILGAGGTKKFAVLARMQDNLFTLSVYDMGDTEPNMRVNLGSCPKAMDVSKNDQYLAIKYSHVVRIFDLQNTTKIDHKLPKMECSKSPPGGHLVAFSHDSLSFMASTRMGPEKVITYWSFCMDQTKTSTAQSNAPCGNIDDHGLTSLALAGPSVRGIPTGFLSTFTEKGSPVILSMDQKQPNALVVRGSRDMFGTRIHSAGMHVNTQTKRSSLVIVNQDNDIFWINDLFGRSQDIERLQSLSRKKSMKPEVLVAMPTSDQANIFWIDQKLQCGMLVKVGKSGGMTKPVEIRLDVEPLCAG